MHADDENDLRDDMAMAALTGIYAAIADADKLRSHNPSVLAKMAYEAANAMLDERLKHLTARPARRSRARAS